MTTNTLKGKQLVFFVKSVNIKLNLEKGFKIHIVKSHDVSIIEVPFKCDQCEKEAVSERTRQNGKQRWIRGQGMDTLLTCYLKGKRIISYVLYT